MGNEERFQQNLKQNVVTVCKRLLPRALIHEVRNCRTYSSGERALYLRIRILKAIGVGITKVPSAPGTCHSILFVCFGNIIRSPMCEALMLAKVATLRGMQISVNSAGLNATEGRAAHPWAVTAAQEFGISLEHHRARQLTDQMVNEADLIFAMDFQNYIQLLSRWPTIRKKVLMLGNYAQGKQKILEIADPFYVGLEQTHACYRILDSCIQKLAHSLYFEEHFDQPRTSSDKSQNSVAKGI